MPSSRVPEAAYLIGQTLLACALDQVNATWSEPGDPTIARACVVWGGIAWDDCECGQLVVAITNQFPSNQFPNPAGSIIGAGGGTQAQSKCGPPIWVIDYTVSILRCAPIQDDSGKPPPCSRLDEYSRVSAIDSWAVRTGIGCCLNSLARDRNEKGGTEIAEYIILGQLSTGPAGMCGGSDLALQVGLRHCFCPPGS